MRAGPVASSPGKSAMFIKCQSGIEQRCLRPLSLSLSLSQTQVLQNGIAM